MYDGSGTNYVEGVGCRMKKGDFCVISPKVYHIFENDGDSVLVNIIIKTDYIEHLFTDSFLLSHPFTDFMRQISGGTEYPKYLYKRSSEYARYQLSAERRSGLSGTHSRTCRRYFASCEPVT